MNDYSVRLLNLVYKGYTLDDALAHLLSQGINRSEIGTRVVSTAISKDMIKIPNRRALHLGCYSEEEGRTNPWSTVEAILKQQEIKRQNRFVSKAKQRDRIDKAHADRFDKEVAKKLRANLIAGGSIGVYRQL